MFFQQLLNADSFVGLLSWCGEDHDETKDS